MVATRRMQRLAESNGDTTKQDDEPTPKQTPSEDSEDTAETDDGDKTSETQKGGSEGVMARFNVWLDNFLFSQVDIAPLVYFRIIFGTIMLYEVYHYIHTDWVRTYYIKPIFYFKYFGFNWMPGPLPDQMMYIFYFAMGMLYIFLVLGLWYRVTSVLCFLGFFYWFNLDMTQHLNHFYLVTLVSFLMMFLPAHRNASLDVIRTPELRVATVPAWTRWLILLQIGIAYFYGGIAKINWDWLQGEPMRSWLIKYAPAFPSIGRYFLTWWGPYFFAWNGMIYDLAVVPLLMWKRTRVVATAATIFFHLMNHHMFTIGIFPWFMLFSTPLYFEPELLRPVLKFEWIFAEPVTTQTSLTESKERRPIVKRLFCSYIAWQCLMPFRHHLYPGNSGWTEEGHLYSWHMKLRSKNAYADFTVKLPSGQVIEIDEDKYLTNRQASRMPKRPIQVMRFAHFLCDGYNKKGLGPVEVYVENMATMNGRKWQHLIDPKQDMCKAKMTMLPTPWIVPLKYPLWEQTVESLLERIDARDGSDFVDTPVVKKIDGNLHFGNITAFDETSGEKSWRVKFDDGGELDFKRKDLATSHRLYARYEHGVIPKVSSDAGVSKVASDDAVPKVASDDAVPKGAPDASSEL